MIPRPPAARWESRDTIIALGLLLVGLCARLAAGASPGLVAGPPGPRWLLGAIAWLVSEPHFDSSVLWPVAAWTPPLVGALVGPIAYATGRLVMGAPWAFAAAFVVALAPVEVASSRPGLVGPGMLEGALTAALAGALVAAALQGRGAVRALWAAAAACLIGAAPLLVPNALVVVGALALGVGIAARRSDGGAMADGGGAALVVGLVLASIAVALAPSAATSLFQPTPSALQGSLHGIALVAVAGLGALFLLARPDPRWSTAAADAVISIATLALGVGLFFGACTVASWIPLGVIVTIRALGSLRARRGR